MPDQIILTTFNAPRWYQDFFYPIWCKHIADYRVKSACRAIIILNWECPTRLGLTNISGCLRDITTVIILINIMNMYLVRPNRVLMLACFNRCTVGTIWLEDCFMPDQVVLTTFNAPSWYQNFFYSIWCNHIADYRIKSACRAIIILNWECATWLGLTNVSSCLRDITTVIVLINIMNMYLVFADRVFVLTRLNRCTVGAIWLEDRLMPDQVILTTFNAPRWYQDFFHPIWCDDITNHCIKGPSRAIIIFNR